MRRSFWILVLAGLAGCAAPKTVVTQAPEPELAHSERKAVEARYDVRGYREAESPAIRHEAHAVFRRTLVPMNAEAMEAVPRTSFAPSSVTPLPASDELNAELTKQKAITAEMVAMQQQMAATQVKMQAQYAQLVEQSGEAMRLRARLEAERAQPNASALTPPQGFTANGDPQKTKADW